MNLVSRLGQTSRNKVAHDLIDLDDYHSKLYDKNFAVLSVTHQYIDADAI